MVFLMCTKSITWLKNDMTSKVKNATLVKLRHLMVVR